MEVGNVLKNQFQRLGISSACIDFDFNMDDDQESGDKSKLNQQSVNIWVQNIKGIEYFIDGSQNVYKHEDVINNSTNPRIIAKYSKNETGAFSIAFL